MGGGLKYSALFVNVLAHLSITLADTYSVQVRTEDHVNLVDTRFLSFTIDPKYLISSGEKYKSKECICMATSLTPAYIRIAGPSTSRMTFRNTTIAIEDSSPRKVTLTNLDSDQDNDYVTYKSKLAVGHRQWEKFAQWAKDSGFDLVFALNNDEKTVSGMWDPNAALDILTAANNENVGDIFWQLGYECTNQSIEEYLNDLETLRVIIETFPPGMAGRWKVVGGDVTHCLQTDSKSDFKDYVTLSNDMMDAILLNGNSSSQELERMSERDRLRLLKLLSTSDTPLWLTENRQMLSELERAADWMTGLGYSARNGFSVHFRELLEEELYEPSLSFYMALLFKNLVGERVLSVELEASQAILFAHCTSLRHRPVPGAVSFYGANLDEEPARFSIKMSKKEEGGDIMQFILGHDRNGNIVVNGRPMYYEGDIRPVVKRVRPYKTLIVNLPPKSFGFWVLANTQVQACYDFDDKSKNKTDDIVSDYSNDEEVINSVKRKRSLNRKVRDVRHLEQYMEFVDGNNKNKPKPKENMLKERIDDINSDLKKAHKVFFLNSKETTHKRLPRQALDENNEKQKKSSNSHKYKLQNRFDRDYFKNNIYNKLSKLSKNHLSRSKNDKTTKLRGLKKQLRTKRKRYLKDHPLKNCARNKNNIHLDHDIEMFGKNEDLEENVIVRNRRSTYATNKIKQKEEESSENEIDIDDRDTLKLGKILHKLKKLSELPVDIQEKDSINGYDEHDSTEGILLKTKVSKDSAVIDISEKSSSGLLRSTLQDILSLLADFNKNINRFWTAITLLE